MPDRSRSADELIEAYKGVRSRVRAAVESAPRDALVGPCPATPAWRVHDVLAHLVGVANDVREGRLEGVASDPWTQAQVDARRTTPEAEMLDAWDVDSAEIEPLFAAVGFERFGQMLFDATTHELDLCHGLGVAADRDNLALDCSFDWIVAVGSLFRDVPLCIRTESDAVTVGPGEAANTVEVPRFEFIRATVGRRSRSQVARYPTDAPMEPELILLAPAMFSLAAADIVE